MLAETDFLLRPAREASREALEEDELLQRAVIYSLMVLGEAANKISVGFREGYGDVAWRKIISTRHRIVHEYFGIDYDIVWQIVTVQISGLHLQLSTILKERA